MVILKLKTRISKAKYTTKQRFEICKIFLNGSKEVTKAAFI